MKILILGNGKMGSFFCDLLCLDHEVAVYDPDVKRLRFTFNAQRFSRLDEIAEFTPELVINAATVKFTIKAFDDVMPYLPDGRNCILSDIASVKTGLPEFYKDCGHPYVSTHPMFGPTFASLSNLSNENAIIINEGDELGRAFLKSLYDKLSLNVHEYSFAEHDEVIAFSLSVPFASTLAFGSVLKKQDAPGTTYKKHMTIAQGLMSEDDYPISEILFNPHTSEQLSKIQKQMELLKEIIDTHDTEKMKQYLANVRKNIYE